MFIKIVDAGFQEVHVNPAHIIAVVIPSAITPGDGKNRIVAVGVVIEVSATEARRVLDEVNQHKAQLQTIN